MEIGTWKLQHKNGTHSSQWFGFGHGNHWRQTKLVSVIVWASCVKLRALCLKCHLHGVTLMWLFGHHVSSLEHHGSSATSMVSLQCHCLEIICHSLFQTMFSGGFPTGQSKKPGQLCFESISTCARNSHANLATLARVWVGLSRPLQYSAHDKYEVNATHSQKLVEKRPPKPINQTSVKPGLPKICLPGTPPPILKFVFQEPPSLGPPKGLEDKFWVHLVLSSRTWPGPRRQQNALFSNTKPQKTNFSNLALPWVIVALTLPKTIMRLWWSFNRRSRSRRCCGCYDMISSNKEWCLKGAKGVQEVEDGTSMILDTGCTKPMCSKYAYLLMREGLSEG